MKTIVLCVILVTIVSWLSWESEAFLIDSHRTGSYNSQLVSIVFIENTEHFKVCFSFNWTPQIHLGR